MCVEIPVSECARVQSLDPDVCIYACMHMCGVYVHQNALNKLESATDGRDVKTEGTPVTNGNADCVWDLTPSLPLFISLLPPAPSVFRSLQLVTGALG